MSPLLQQLLTLTGVVIGALGSYSSVMRGDRARFRREQAARWGERRLNAYADYAQSLKAVVSLLFRVAAHFGNDRNPHPCDPGEAAPRLDSAEEARGLAWETMLLLGAPDVVDAGREWAVAVAEMQQFVQAETHDPDGWCTLVENQRIARQRYYATSRRDLALSTGHTGRWQITPSGDQRTTTTDQ